MATTLGSRTTMPLSFTYTSVLAVPRSMPMSLERNGKYFARKPNIREIGRGGWGSPVVAFTPETAGADAVPADATAVVANVTVTDTTATSHLTVSPAGDPVPTVSDLNWTAGKNVPNLVVATVGADGQIELTNFAGSTDVVVDVVGWFS